MIKLILRLFFLLLSIFLFMTILYELFSFYFFVSTDTSADIVLGSGKFYILLFILTTIATFINASIFHLISLKVNSLSQEFITFISIFSSIIICSPLIYFLLIKVESNVVNIIIIMIPFGMIIPTISSVFSNKIINRFIKPKFLTDKYRR